jgi:hypothetical protein
MIIAALLSVAVFVPAGPEPAAEKPRKASSIAPCLPALTSAEEDRLDEVIDRFIQYDTGKLRGSEGLKALREFEALGIEAIPALIRGLNRAAEIEHSCPVLVISRKLHKMLMASKDVELLEFAHDEIGAGVTRSSHARPLADMRAQYMLRRNALLREQRSAPKGLASLSVAQLVRAADSEKGPRLRQVLVELQTRQSPEVMPTLATATTHADKEIGRLAVDLLDKNLSRQPVAEQRKALTSDNSEIRKAAIRSAIRNPVLVPDVINRLNDDQTEVREVAHTALVKLNQGRDLGMETETWQTWWQRQRR